MRWIDSGRDEPPENGYWRCQCGVTFAPDAVESGIAHGWAEARASSEVPPDHGVTWIDAGRDEPPENGCWQCACGKHFAPDGVDEYAKHRAESARVDRDSLSAALPEDFGPFWDEVQGIGGWAEATFNRERFADAILARLTPPSGPTAEAGE